MIIGMSVLSGVLMAGLLVPIAGLVSMGAKRSADAADTWPLRLTFRPLAERSSVTASDGTRIATFYDENRVYVPLSEIAPVMQQALVAIEDVRFYQHGALDIRGTLRALVKNQTSGQVVQGGSTITQQLVKLTLQVNARTAAEFKAASARTVQRKILEWRYATWVEEHLTKKQILEHYLNAAYFGDGAYGIEAASKHYFSVSATDLTLKQAATLAGLVKNPTGFDPARFPNKAVSRRDTVIGVMYDQHLISQRAKKRIVRSPLALKPHATNNGCLTSKAPFFCDYVEKYLLTDTALGDTADERKRLLYGGGLKIRTTIDLRFQRAADDAVAKSVYAGDHAVGALAVVQPRTGYVRAIAQSRPMGNNKKKHETFIDYVVPPEYGGLSGFQAGSTFKLFVLSAAIQQGIPLHYTINSPPVLDLGAKPLTFATCDGSITASSGKIPTSTTSGVKDLYTGTQQSVNTFFILLEQKTGLCRPWRLAKAMGVNPGPKYSHNGANGYMVPTFTLGVSDVSPLEMAEAYATVAGRGLHCKATPILEIRDRNRRVIPTSGPQCNRVMTRPQADAVNDILKGVQEPGGFGAIYGDTIPQQSAAKTGTTDSKHSVWFMGYTPNMVTASMVAGVKADGTPTNLDNITLAGQCVCGLAHGSTLAGGMWKKAMDVISQWLPDATFTPPPQSVIDGNSITLQSYFGWNPTDAAADLSKRGISPVIASSVNSDAPYGTVAYVYPQQGVVKGDTVTIYLSNGHPTTPPVHKPVHKPGNGPVHKPGHSPGNPNGHH